MFKADSYGVTHPTAGQLAKGLRHESHGGLARGADILAYGDRVPEGAEYNVSADIIDFSILNIGPDFGSNRGNATITLLRDRLGRVSGTVATCGSFR